MCCLTIYKTKDDKLVVTHNRDEQPARQVSANKVVTKIINDRKVFMPEDSLSGGTWIATDDVTIAALLNGFKEKHIRKPYYRASRGSIIPQFFNETDIDAFVRRFDPSGLEPFTLILVTRNEKGFEIGWDEKNMHISMLTCDTPLIYSSATLYDGVIQSQRKNLFKRYLQKDMDADDLWLFHKNKGDNHGNYINVDYNDEISTVAISQIVFADKSTFYYQSLVNNNSKLSFILA